MIGVDLVQVVNDGKISPQIPTFIKIITNFLAWKN